MALCTEKPKILLGCLELRFEGATIGGLCDLHYQQPDFFIVMKEVFRKEFGHEQPDQIESLKFRHFRSLYIARQGFRRRQAGQ